MFLNVIQGCKKDDDPPVNQPPVADARISKTTVITTDTLTLIGYGSDVDGSISGYLWSQISGPNHATLINPGSSTTVANGFAEGKYLFQLMVTDNKGATSVDTVSVNAIPPPCTEKGKWSGIYATPNLPFQYVEDATFINNGVAQLNSSPWSYFYTSISLHIPECRQFSADSTKFTVYLKNPSDQPGSVAPYDVSLWLYGSIDTGYVQFLAQYPELTALKVGNTGITNTTDLIHLFQDWTELTLEAKNKKLSVYMNGALIQQIAYSGAEIGFLQQIQIGLKGAGSVDWVKLYNSNTNKQIMQEDFNVSGQSTIQWY